LQVPSKGFCAVFAAFGISLSGCGFFPTVDPQEFTISALAPAPAPKSLQSQDPDLIAHQSRSYCADGYEKLNETNYPSDSGPLSAWRIRCAPYSFSLF
jgi:hypothetical protein